MDVPVIPTINGVNCCNTVGLFFKAVLRLASSTFIWLSSLAVSAFTVASFLRRESVLNLEVCLTLSRSVSIMAFSCFNLVISASRSLIFVFKGVNAFLTLLFALFSLSVNALIVVSNSFFLFTLRSVSASARSCSSLFIRLVFLLDKACNTTIFALAVARFAWAASRSF